MVLQLLLLLWRSKGRTSQSDSTNHLPLLLCSVYHLLQPTPQGAHTSGSAASGGRSDLQSPKAGTPEHSGPPAITDLNIATVATVSRCIWSKKNRQLKRKEISAGSGKEPWRRRWVVEGGQDKNVRVRWAKVKAGVRKRISEKTIQHRKTTKDHPQPRYYRDFLMSTEKRQISRKGPKCNSDSKIIFLSTITRKAQRRFPFLSLPSHQWCCFCNELLKTPFLSRYWLLQFKILLTPPLPGFSQTFSKSESIGINNSQEGRNCRLMLSEYFLWGKLKNKPANFST